MQVAENPDSTGLYHEDIYNPTEQEVQVGWAQDVTQESGRFHLSALSRLVLALFSSW